MVVVDVVLVVGVAVEGASAASGCGGGRAAPEGRAGVITVGHGHGHGDDHVYDHDLLRLSRDCGHGRRFGTWISVAMLDHSWIRLNWRGQVCPRGR